MTAEEIVKALRGINSRSKRKILDEAADYISKRCIPEVIESHCANAICSYDELNMKFAAVSKERDELREELKRCVCELCLKCGLYTKAYDGACDMCRWKK